MSIGPLNEILVSITNIILKSDVNATAFPDIDLTDFDRWQDDLLQSARQVYDHWHEDNDLTEAGLNQFEATFSSIFTPKEKAQ